MKRRAAELLAALLALCVWELAAACIHNRLLLVGPWAVLQRLWQLLPEAAFLQAVGFTFTRITAGFLLAFLIAGLLAALSACFPLAEILLRPYMVAVQTVPVASFIVIAFLWLSSRQLSVFIAFLMVLPVLYSNLLQGIRSADRKLLEMGQVFGLSAMQKLRCILLPAIRPYALSACHVALGLCWKAGVAAEVIGVCSGSIGGMLYEAKVYVEIADLFAWTMVIIFTSLCFERAFVFLLNRMFCLLEAWV